MKARCRHAPDHLSAGYFVAEHADGHLARREMRRVGGGSISSYKLRVVQRARVCDREAAEEMEVEGRSGTAARAMGWVAARV